MNNYVAEVLERAVRDMSEIYEYIRKDKESAAIKVYNEIEKAIENLCAFPFKGTLVDKDDRAMSGYRYVMVRPYLVFYKINGKKITVYHVIDGKRDYLNILE